MKKQSKKKKVTKKKEETSVDLLTENDAADENSDLDLVEDVDLDVTKPRLKSKKRESGGYSDSSISWYLDQINKIPLLSREEEDSLARATRDGDENAKNRLIKANLRFVVSIAKKYQTSGISLLDLILSLIHI